MDSTVLVTPWMETSTHLTQATLDDIQTHQDTLQPLQGLISCIWVTGMMGTAIYLMQKKHSHTFHLVQYDAEGWSLDTIQFHHKDVT